MTYEIHGHMLSNTDIDNPKNWPLYRKIYASSVAFTFAFVVSVHISLSPPPFCITSSPPISTNILSSAFGLTAYTAGISELPSKFDISMTEAIAGFSLYLFGIAFAPIHTPHLSEKYGRVPVYMVCLPLWMLFVLGTGLAQNFATVAVCRFLAGATGGPALVLIEGTFADVWSVEVTGRYYAVLTAASYFGAACGELSFPSLLKLCSSPP
jgi:MFS transporter, DHA1 family, multidrug resistance protein